MPVKHYKKRVLMLLAEGFELIECSCFTDVFAWASFQDEVEITLTSASKLGFVNAAFGGFSLRTEALISDLDLATFDALALPGGMEWAGYFEDALGAEFAAVIEHFASHNKAIGAVCVASRALANGGALSNKPASIYHSATGVHKGKLEALGAKFVDQPLVKAGNITTSTGPGTAVEVALSLLNELCDAEVASKTRAMMRIPQPQDSWYQPQV